MDASMKYSRHYSLFALINLTCEQYAHFISREKRKIQVEGEEEKEYKCNAWIGHNNTKTTRFDV